MANPHTNTMQIPWTGPGFKCPICGNPVSILICIVIKSATARHAGTDGMDPIISTSVDSEADGAIIHHTCSKILA